MNKYTFLSIGYDLVDKIWFSEKNGRNPREVVKAAIPDKDLKVLDLCCGTFTNGLSIAASNIKNRVYGIDLSKAMLREAKQKARKAGIANAYLKCADATDTGLPSGSVDYVVIGLVLHECAPALREGILKEAHRLLKDDGRLIVLEWEKQERFFKKMKYAPLYLLESLNCKAYKDFYKSDKGSFFNENGFKTVKLTHCNYSVVIEMEVCGFEK